MMKGEEAVLIKEMVDYRIHRILDVGSVLRGRGEKAH